jgi:hypothetical protein
MQTHSSQRDPVRAHRRAVWLKIIAPVVLPFLALLALFAALAVLSGRGYTYAKRPLRLTRRVTKQIAEKTDHIAPRLTQPLVNMNVTITKWEQTVRNWQSESAQSGPKESDND